MAIKSGRATGEAKQLSRNVRLLMAAILAAAAVAGALVLFQPPAPQTGSPAAVPLAGNAQVSLARERAEEHQFLAERNATTAAMVAVTRRDVDFKESWMEPYVAPSETSLSLARERIEEHAWLLQRNLDTAAAAANWNSRLVELNELIYGSNAAAATPSDYSAAQEMELARQRYEVLQAQSFEREREAAAAHREARLLELNERLYPSATPVPDGIRRSGHPY